jgi:16S rRNA (cytosine967-C5)-methyltransferase
MTPGARWQSVIELLDDVASGGAADAAASSYFRQRRFIGSKDRAFIAAELFRLLRRRARLDWWINRTLERPEGAPPPPGRFWLVADLVLDQRWDAEKFKDTFTGEKHHPAELSRAERTLLDQLSGHKINSPEMPEWVLGEYPLWIEPELQALFNGDKAEIDAMNEPAAMDLRVNTLVASRETALATLAAADIQAEATKLSPLGIRVKGRPALGHQEFFQKGMVEIQDEGSQLVALLAEVEPGQAVIDYCAGAGGKTLAMAAQMQNKGRLVASDISEKRLERAVKRLRRAGAHNVERRALTPENHQWFKRQAGRFDRVLVDAPCTGTGTWRRNPDMKWKIGPDDLAELTVLQREILATASKLVKPGGRLIYATCSVLRSENEDAIEDFLAKEPGFALAPVPEIWPRIAESPCPVEGPYLRLTPARHGTDGFFAAILQRSPAP